MTVHRDKRTIPLSLTADALNTGLVRAYDFAAGDGAPHVGSGTLSKTGTVALADTLLGSSTGRTIGSGYYSLASAGLTGGTADWTTWLRMQTVGSEPTANGSDDILVWMEAGTGNAFLLNLYELTRSGYHPRVTNASGTYLPDNGVSGQGPAALVDFHLRRSGNTLSLWCNGVKTHENTGYTLDIGTPRAIYFGHPTGAQKAHILIDFAHWNRALSDAEIADHQADPYWYYAHTDSIIEAIRVTAPATGQEVPATLHVDGEYDGSPSVIEARYAGGAWQTLDARPQGRRFGGVLTGLSGSGALEVRFRNKPAITSSVSGLTVGTDTISITSPVDCRLYQRNGSNVASVPVVVAWTGSPVSLEVRLNGGAWTSAAAGTSPQTVTLTGQPVGQGVLEARFSDKAGVRAVRRWVGVGDIYAVWGQSNGSGQAARCQNRRTTAQMFRGCLFGNDDAWKELQDPFDSASGQVDSVSSDGAADGSFTPMLADLVLAHGVPVGFVPCAKGSTSISAWARNLSTAFLYGSGKRRVDAVGGVRAVIWWQGENDAVTGTPQATYEAALNQLVNDIQSDMGIKTLVVKIWNYGGGYTTIRAAQDAVAASNGNVCAIADVGDAIITGGGGDTLHYYGVREVRTISTRLMTALLTAGAVGSDLLEIVSVGEVSTSTTTAPAATSAFEAAFAREVMDARKQAAATLFSLGLVLESLTSTASAGAASAQQQCVDAILDTMIDGVMLRDLMRFAGDVCMGKTAPGPVFRDLADSVDAVTGVATDGNRSMVGLH